MGIVNDIQRGVFLATFVGICLQPVNNLAGKPSIMFIIGSY